MKDKTGLKDAASPVPDADRAADKTASTGGTLAGGIKEKLVAVKSRWAREGKHLGMGGSHTEGGKPPSDRLPPGQHVVTNWPVLDLGIQPAVDKSDWRLMVDGLVDAPCNLDWAAFQALPQTDSLSDIHCVTTWSRYDNRWRGVAVSDLLAAVRPQETARFAVLYSYDGYTTNLPLHEFAAPGALLATHWQDAPLTREHGGPVRAVVPQLYFWKSAKWINRIMLIAEDRPGFWEERGYHNYGDPYREERYGA